MYLVYFFDLCTLLTPAAKARSASHACFKCGIIAKSDRSSCCGRGGAWFGDCGSAGNAERRHTWYEGIQVCKARAQLRTGNGQHLAAQQSNPSHGFGKAAVVRHAKTFPVASSNIPITMYNKGPLNGSTIMSTVYLGKENSKNLTFLVLSLLLFCFPS